MEGKEIIKLLEDNVTTYDFAYNDFGVGVLDDLGLGKIEYVSHQEGNINSTSYAHVVAKFVDHDVLIKLEGWYSSYSGCAEWDEGTYKEVKLVEKTITVYE